jgi:hypothetical protein
VIIPNTLVPEFCGLDEIAIARQFAPYLSSAAKFSWNDIPLPDDFDLPRMLCTVERQVSEAGGSLSNDGNNQDVHLKNLVGDRALKLASKWSCDDLDSSMSRKMVVLRKWLGLYREGVEGTRRHLDSLDTRQASEDDESSQHYDEAEVERTMLRLFAPQAGIELPEDRPESQESQPEASKDVYPISPVSSPVRVQLRYLLIGNSLDGPRFVIRHQERDCKPATPIGTPPRGSPDTDETYIVEGKRRCTAAASLTPSSPRTPTKRPKLHVLFSPLQVRNDNLGTPSATTSSRKGVNYVSSSPKEASPRTKQTLSKMYDISSPPKRTKVSPSKPRHSKTSKLSRRLEIAGSLKLECDDKEHAQTMRAKVERRVTREMRKEEYQECIERIKTKSLEMPIPESDHGGVKVDWNRSFLLAQQIRMEARKGKRISLMMPLLQCTNPDLEELPN